MKGETQNSHVIRRKLISGKRRHTVGGAQNGRVQHLLQRIQLAHAHNHRVVVRRHEAVQRAAQEPAAVMHAPGEDVRIS